MANEFTYTLLPGGGSGNINDGGDASITVVAGGMLKVKWNTAYASDFLLPVMSTNLPTQPTITPGAVTISDVAYGIAIICFGFGGVSTGTVPPGVYNLALDFNDGVNNQSCAFLVTVGAAAGLPIAAGAPVVAASYAAMTLNAWSFPAAVPIAFQLSASNLPTAWSASQIPAGLSIDNNGNVTGIVYQPGNYQLTVVASNAAGSSASQSFSINITAATGAAPVAALIPWLDPSIIDLQVTLNLRRVVSATLGSVAGFTEGEDLQFAVLPMMGSTFITSGITSLSLTIRPTGNFNCQPMEQQAGATTPTAVAFPISVLTSSTTSSTVTVAAVPANLVTGSALLGSTVQAISGTTLTLAANANATISTSTPETFTTPTQQYYLIAFNLESARLHDWFALANLEPTVNAPVSVACQAVLRFVYNSKCYITEPVPFMIFQSSPSPDQF